MFQVGDAVMYGSYGVCRISDIREEKFGTLRQAYYVLQPIHDVRSTFYCPVKNGEKLRPLLTPEQVNTLICEMKSGESDWIDEDARRREQFGAVLKGGDHRAMISLIKAVYQQGQSRAAEGRRLHVADERAMRDAERLLYEEFAHVLGIEKSEVLGYIQATLQQVS